MQIPISRQQGALTPVSVLKILLFPYRNNTDDQLVLDYPERCTVFSDPDPESGFIGRASLYFLDILVMERVRDRKSVV